MATVVYGTTNDFNAGIYSEPHPNTVRFLQNQMENYAQASSTFVGAATSFVDKAKQVYEEFLNSETVRRSRAALDRMASAFQTNDIRWLRTPTEVQQAPPIMQRFIMAEPGLRKLFIDQRCSGYDGEYVDLEPGKIGLDHYDYRRVVNGMALDDPDDGGWVVHEFVEDLRDGDRELETSEKIAGLNTWDLVRSMLERGKEDPSSKTGGLL